MQIETTAWAVVFLYRGTTDDWGIWEWTIKRTRREAIAAWSKPTDWRKDRRKGVVKAVRVRVLAEVHE